MKNLFLLSFLMCLISGANGQKDPEAQKILDRVAAKTKTYQTIQSDFELIIENHRENQNSKSKGVLKIKGSKYYMETLGSKVYFNGKTLWSFMEDVNEVTINEPDTSDEGFVENPTKIFNFYNRDFKYRLIGDVKLPEGEMYEIDLFPNNLEQPYSRFKVYIRHDNDALYMISAVGKDGVDYTAYLRNMQFNLPMKDEQFIFKPEDHKGIEVVDLRF